MFSRATTRATVAWGIATMVAGSMMSMGCARASDTNEAVPEEWRADVEAWHARRIASLHRPDGWLSLVGLHALPTGTHRLGSGEDQDLIVPASHPPHIGVLQVETGAENTGFVITLSAAPDVDLRHDGAAVTTIEMQADAGGAPTVLEVGTLSFLVIERDGRPYLRVRDRESSLLQTFEGIERWPVDPKWRVLGRWVPYDSPRVIRVPNIIGTVDEVEVSAAVEFEIGGKSFRLDPISADGTLFIVFGDATNGVESYGAGRFLYTDLPDEQGNVVLDFNRSYNPPCVYTPYATCPLPPEGCVLDVEIHAGEKMWGAQH